MSSKTMTIDLTPEGLKTQEGIKRVQAAEHEMHESIYQVAQWVNENQADIRTALIRLQRDFEKACKTDGSGDELAEVRNDLNVALERWRDAGNALCAAVSGR